MKYHSSRSDWSSPSEALALLLPFAPDRGLLVPEYLPYYDENKLEALKQVSFSERVVQVLADFLPSFSERELRACVQEAYGGEVFDTEAVFKLVNMNPYVNREYLLELWHGPSLSCKDYSLRLLWPLWKLALQKLGEKRPLRLLLASQGDLAQALLATLSGRKASQREGKSADWIQQLLQEQTKAMATEEEARAQQGAEGAATEQGSAQHSQASESERPVDIQVDILLPQREWTETQLRWLQWEASYLESVQAKTGGQKLAVDCYALPQGFEQLQEKVCQELLRFVKWETEETEEGAEKPGIFLLSPHSHCLARLLPMIAVYVNVYLEFWRQQEELAEKQGLSRAEVKKEVNLVVPTGNLLNLQAVWSVRQMGIPFKKIVCATNRNKQLTGFFNSGHFEGKKAVVTSNSPALDRQFAPNLERLLFDLCKKPEKVAAWMEDLASKAEFLVEPIAFRRLQASFVSGFADNEGTLRSLREIYDQTDFAVEPHTAVGLNVYRRYAQRVNEQAPVIYMSPQSPFKMAALVTMALQLGGKAGRKRAEGLSELDLWQPLAEEIGLPLSEDWLQSLKQSALRPLKTLAERKEKEAQEEALSRLLAAESLAEDITLLPMEDLHRILKNRQDKLEKGERGEKRERSSRDLKGEKVLRSEKVVRSDKLTRNQRADEEQAALVLPVLESRQKAAGEKGREKSKAEAREGEKVGAVKEAGPAKKKKSKGRGARRSRGKVKGEELAQAGREKVVMNLQQGGTKGDLA